MPVAVLVRPAQRCVVVPVALSLFKRDVLAQEGVCVGHAEPLIERPHDLLGATDALAGTGFAGARFVTGQ